MKKVYTILFLLLVWCTSPVFSQVFSVPYFDDFESGSPGWTVTNTGGAGWQLGTPNFGTTNSTYSGSNSWDTDLQSAYSNGFNGTLSSPPFHVAGLSGVKVSFWLNYNAEQYWDGLRLEYATDSLGIWNLVGSINAVGSMNWYNYPNLNSSAMPGWSGNSGGWVQSSIILPAFADPIVYFRFVFTSDASVIMDGFSIDDFSVEHVAMNSVTGTVYIDANSNNIIDPADFPAQNITMTSVPNGGYYYYPTNANGHYSFFAGSAVNTTVSPVLPPYSTAIPASITVNIAGTNQVSSGNDFLLTFQPGITDPQITIISTPVRPGFSHYKTLDLFNQGTTWVSGTVELTYDAAYTLVNTSVPYTVIGTNIIEFTYNALLPNEHRSIVIEFSTSPSLTVGQTTTASAVIFPVSGDVHPGNNYDSVTTTTVNSCDPNNKLADPEGDVLVQDVAAGTDLHYTVNFQNTGTASAVYVNIFDMIDENLDLSTFEITGTSHPLTSWNIGSNRQAQFSFVNINLPDSTTNELESHGFVSYRIRPFTSLVTGTQINNVAAIIFDFNQPIVTNIVSTTVIDPVGIQEVSTPVWLYPNPANGHISFQAADNFTHYRIVNALGQQVLENSIFQPGQLQTVPLSGMPSGMYLLVVSDAKSISKSSFMIE